MSAGEERFSFGAMVSDSNAMRKVIGVAKDVALVNINVMITGETGTGKELLARAIHQASPRHDKPFVAVNCAGIPETLLETELFGHEKGAFTDAADGKRGKFEVADGGTLFLDEIGDMSLMAQAKILRAVEGKVIEHVGGEKPIPVNCRIIAATNKDLRKAVRAGEFREDLFYRLCETSLHLPPLRERKEDIPLLVKHFIGIFNEEFHKKVTDVSHVVMDYFMRHDWPGNVRELKSLIKIGMVLIQRDHIWLEDLPLKLQVVSEEGLAPVVQSGFLLDDVEREHVRRVLEHCQWKKAMAAKLLGVSRPRLDRKISKHGLRP